MDNWISVAERLPTPFVSVLVFMPNEHPLPTVHEGFVDRCGLWSVDNLRIWSDKVTHWMPMPLPPMEYLEKYLKGGADND